MDALAWPPAMNGPAMRRRATSGRIRAARAILDNGAGPAGCWRRRRARQHRGAGWRGHRLRDCGDVLANRPAPPAPVSAPVKAAAGPAGTCGAIMATWTLAGPFRAVLAMPGTGTPAPGGYMRGRLGEIDAYGRGRGLAMLASVNVLAKRQGRRRRPGTGASMAKAARAATSGPGWRDRRWRGRSGPCSPCQGRQGPGD